MITRFYGLKQTIRTYAKIVNNIFSLEFPPLSLGGNDFNFFYQFCGHLQTYVFFIITLDHLFCCLQKYLCRFFNPIHYTKYLPFYKTSEGQLFFDLNVYLIGLGNICINMSNLFFIKNVWSLILQFILIFPRHFTK